LGKKTGVGGERNVETALEAVMGNALVRKTVWFAFEGLKNH
jgi:hypothetical protein